MRFLKSVEQSVSRGLAALSFPALFLWVGTLQSAEGPGWGHLIFNEETNPLKAVPDSEGERGVSMAVLVSPKDNRDWDHRGNSNLAHISILEYASGGEALLEAGEGKVETLLIVAGGTAKIKIGSFKSGVVKEDVIFVPSGLSFAAKVTGEEPLRLVKAVWKEEGAVTSTNLKPVVRSESRDPFDYFSEGGYISVAPAPRQEDTGLTIVGMGGHTRLSASLLYYPEDLESRNNFKGNSLMVRSALSQYGPDGGTPAHSHHGVEQAFFILSGRGLFEIGYTTTEVKAGDLIFAPKHVAHGCKVLGKKPLKWIEMEWAHAW